MDTLAYAKKLEAAGVPGSRAEAQAEALEGTLRDQAVTRTDLLDAFQDFEERSDRKLEKRLDEVKKEILSKFTLRLISAISAATAFLGILIGIFR